MIYLLAKSNRAIEALRAWRDNTANCQRAWRAFADSVGADSYLQFSAWDKPTSFTFSRNNPPDGWTKPNGRHHAAHPRKTNKEGRAQVDALPQGYSEATVAEQFGLPTALSYKNRMMRLGNAFNPYQIGWTDREFFLACPDFLAAKEEHGHKEGFSFNVGTGDLPRSDFEQITQAQMNLLHAQAELRREARG